jgi:FkbM family methyltransferase
LRPLAAEEPIDKVESSPTLTVPAPGAPYRVLKVGPGWSARLQFWILKRFASVLRAVGSVRFYPMIWLVGKLFRRRNHVDVSIQDQCDMRIGLGDPYWMFFVLNQQFYEPDLKWLFEAVAHAHRQPKLLVDCGANVGWCSLVASKRFGFQAIAVEPSTHLVEQIEYNRQLNQGSFPIVRKAIWKENNIPLSFLTGFDAHAGGHLKEVEGFVPDWRVTVEERVTTVTVDSLVENWKREQTAGDNLMVVI